ncbi:MAG: HlyD family secretion protein, partial [Lachnospiraceae bacterium]|nr:HlyD family secretion protein [Lachnospiraceae bacterium]
SAYTGEIVTAFVEEGDYVEEGDSLFDISSTDLDLQAQQIRGMIEVDTKKIEQYERLEQCIKDGVNRFDENDEDDKPYYYQYETYLSQVEQKDLDVSAYKNYNYTDEQIRNAVGTNGAAIAEVYYSTLKSIADSVQTLKTEVSNYEIQLASLNDGQAEYRITASTSGFVHMDTEYREGMVVQAAAALGSIVNENDSYTISVYTSADDMPRIHLGDTADVSVSGLTQSLYGTRNCNLYRGRGHGRF